MAKAKIGCNLFPCRKDEARQVSDPGDLQLPLAEGSEAGGEHCLHLLMKGPDPGFHVSW